MPLKNKEMIPVIMAIDYIIAFAQALKKCPIPSSFWPIWQVSDKLAKIGLFPLLPCLHEQMNYFYLLKFLIGITYLRKSIA